MARLVHIVPHTHWDREWYRPFQSFRMELVDLLDRLLPELEQDPAYVHFMLDGQMAVVDDYLAIRPEAEPTLRQLAASGRLSLGPWYILMDEFLVSGETMIRNLQMGLDRATAFGGAMEVGYLPDMFGHVAQMPQLLQQFGFEHAVVWRGVPAAIDRDGFWWGSPDGSTVRATYLPQGYGNGAFLPDSAKALVARVAEWCDEQGDLAGDPVLWMNGTDHLMPQAWLGRVVAEANAIQDDFHLVVTSLTEHVELATGGTLPAWNGELRSGARANLLMGVGSTRVDVKVRAARAERVLERVAEPLSALYLDADRWPAAFLDEAWLQVVRNSAHDSICACSADEVVAAVLHRFDEAIDIGQGLADRAVRALARRVGGDRALVVNPSARARSGLVTIELPGIDPAPGAQLIAVRPARELIHTIGRAHAEQVVLRELDINPRIHAVTVETADDGTVDVTLYADATEPDPPMVSEISARLRELADAGPSDGPVRITEVRLPSQTVLARVTDVPGFGWRRLELVETPAEPVTSTLTSMTNGLVSVDLDAHTGTWSIDGLAGFGRLVDDGDAGDSYNHCPPDVDQVVDEPVGVSVERLEDGPLRARFEVVTSWRWPHRVEDGARVGDREAVVRTELELRAGEDLLRVTHHIDNPSLDHRLRVWFPLPEPTATSSAESAFAVVQRGLTAEGGPNERPVPTFPSRRFVSAGGVTVVHEGLLEYELVDVEPVVTSPTDGPAPRAKALALTLLRCVGTISKGPMASRPLPAGPPTPTPAAQMPGQISLRYALCRSGRDPLAVVDDAFLPLVVVPAAGGDAADGDAGSALTVTGAEVSALRRRAGRVELRVVNMTDQTTTVAVDGRSGWLVDLRGQAIEPFAGTFELRPWGIATAVLDEHL
jgi:alpha-mannosidase